MYVDVGTELSEDLLGDCHSAGLERLHGRAIWDRRVVKLGEMPENFKPVDH